MPMETKKRRSKTRSQKTPVDSPNGRSNQGENKNADLGDNTFYPTSSHRGARDVEGDGGAKGQPRGRESGPADKSEPEKDANAEQDWHNTGERTDKR